MYVRENLLIYGTKSLLFICTLEYNSFSDSLSGTNKVCMYTYSFFVEGSIQVPMITICILLAVHIRGSVGMIMMCILLAVHIRGSVGMILISLSCTYSWQCWYDNHVHALSCTYSWQCWYDNDMITLFYTYSWQGQCVPRVRRLG